MVNAVQILPNTQWAVNYCITCGIPFAVPKEIDDEWQCQGNTKNFHCPNGHTQHYLKQSDKVALAAAQKALQNETKRREWAEQDAKRAKEERDHKERQRRAEKALRTRLKKRIQNGVCPCCNRTFVNLQRHMAGKHPGFEQLGTA